MDLLVSMWQAVLDFLKFKSESADSIQKQKTKAQKILDNLNKNAIKSKIFYLSDIFNFVNELNLQLQGRKSDLVTCSQKIKGFINKLKYWKTQLDKQALSLFKNLNSINSSPECVIEGAEHLEGLKKDFERRYEELINTTYPLWFQDLANFEPEDTMEPEVVQELLDLKQNSKLSRRVQDEGVFGYIEIKSTNPQIYDLVEYIILSDNLASRSGLFSCC